MAWTPAKFRGPPSPPRGRSSMVIATSHPAPEASIALSSSRATRISEKSLQFPEPKVAERNPYRAATRALQADQSLRLEFRRVLIDEHRHHAAVHELRKRVPAGDQVDLVPVSHFKVAAQF